MALWLMSRTIFLLVKKSQNFRVRSSKVKILRLIKKSINTGTFLSSWSKNGQNLRVRSKKQIFGKIGQINGHCIISSAILFDCSKNIY